MFLGIFKFPSRIPDNRNGGKLKVCPVVKRSFGNGPRDLGASRLAILAQATASGHTRVHLAPSQPPLTPQRGHHQAPEAPPLLPRGPLSSPTRTPSPRSLGGGAAAKTPSNLLTSPPSQAEALCHPAAGQAGRGGRWGSNGARRGARAGRSQGRGCPLG